MNKEDLVRGRIPTPGEEMPPLYYGDTNGSFVRADITYLRQDFSLVQPVANPGKWPGFQRFDYLLRTRKATPKEIAFLKGLQKDKKLDDPYAQRDAVLFALREITGTDKGIKTESWLPLLEPLQNPLPSSVEKKTDAPNDREKQVFKRRDTSTDEELRKQLQQVAELGFDQNGAAFLLTSLRPSKGGFPSKK